MAERDFFISIRRQDCVFHPGENFACVKHLGPLSEEDAQQKAEVLREILPELSEGIEARRNGNSADHIPQMCQDCKFRLGENGG